jgi:uncharacterized protein YjbI with pentapeptide repeats
MNDSPAATVKAETLSSFIQANKAIKPYEGLVIVGDLNLADLTYDHKLTLRKCTFQGHVDATDCHFKKTVDLSGSTFEKGITFAGAYIDHLLAPGCTFKGPFAANEVRFDQSVDLSGGVFSGSVNFQGTRIAGNLLLTDAVIKKTAGFTCLELTNIEGNLIGYGLQAETYLDFTNASIRGKTDFSPSQQPMRCQGDLFMSGAKFSGEVIFNKAEIQGSMFLEEAEIHGSLRCNDLQMRKRQGEDQSGGANLRGLITSGLLGFERARLEGNVDLQSVEIRGGMFFQEAQIDGHLKMPAAKIKTATNFSGARFGAFLSMVVAAIEGNVLLDDVRVGWKGPEPEKSPPGAEDIKEALPADNVGTMFLEGLQVSNEVHFHRSHLRGNLQLAGARIGGNLFMDDSRIEHMLDLANAEIQGSLWFYSSQAEVEAFIGGLAWLSGAKVGGAVNFRGIIIGEDLNLTSLVVKEFLRLDKDDYGRPTRITGDVDFSAAKVTGGVQMNEANIGRGMKAIAAEVSGGLVCTAARFGGPVDFSGSSVSGRVDFQRVHFEGPAVFALIDVDGDVEFQDAAVAGDFNLKDASIQGELVCRDMQVAGQDAPDQDKAGAYLTGLKVTGDVDFSGARIEDRLAMDRAAIDGRLRFSFRADPPTQISGRLFLNACSVRHADFDHQKDGCKISKAGKLPKVDLQGFQFQELDVPEKDYIGFLSRTEPFRQTSYVLIEQWLRNRGKDKEAESIFFAMRDRSNQEAMANRSFVRKFINRVWRGVSRVFLFVAFRSFFLILLAVGLFGLTVFVFSDPQSVKSKSDFVVEADTWSVVKSVRLALNLHFPGGPVSLLDRWEPSDNVLWHCDWIPGHPFNITYQDYAHAAWWITYVAVLPLLGIGFLIKWSRRRAAETPG